MPPRILVIKLADIGDVLLTTPALRLLRTAYPQARIDYLTTANGALALRGSKFIDEVIEFNKFSYDRVRDAVRPEALVDILRFAWALRQRAYDIVLLLHHLTLRFGAFKYNGLMWATGAPRRLGLDNGRGWAFTERVPDLGFGATHEVEYALDVARLAVGYPATSLTYPPTPLPEKDGGEVRPNPPAPFPDREGGEMPPSLRRGGDGGEVRPNPPAPFPDREGGEMPPSLRRGGDGGEVELTRHPLDLDFVVPETAHEQAQRWLAGLGGGPRVALFPGSGAYSLARRWPAAYFAQVADALQDQGVQVVLVGRGGDDTAGVVAAMRTPPALDLTDQGNLGDLAAVLARMDLLLTNDGGPMHIASAVGTSVVAVFGLSNDQAYGPWDRGQPPRLWPPRSDAPPTLSRHTVIKLGLGCQPCLYRGSSLGSRTGCLTRECLTLLPPAMVLRAVEERLKTKD